MKVKGLRALLISLMALAVSTPVAAAVRPYLRADFGGGRFDMPEVDKAIEAWQKAFADAGVPADIQTVGNALGPSLSAGVWVLPWFRLGGTFTYQRAVRDNVYDSPGVLTYRDHLDFRMSEVGVEGAVRIPALAGLTMGGTVTRGRARMIENFYLDNAHGVYTSDGSASKTRTTYGAFVGFDQTNAAGLAGYVRIGYQFRDMGSMPSSGTESDGVTYSSFESTTVPIDYSGAYVRLGVGWDFMGRGAGE